MPRPNNFHIVCGVLCFCLGVLVSGLLLKWCIIKPDFLSVRFAEILEIFVMIFVAYYVTQFIKNKTGNESARKRLAFQLISKFEEEFEKLYSNGLSYMDKPYKKMAGQIKMEIKSCHHCLKLLQSANDDQLKKELSCLNLEKWKLIFADVKENLTGSQFDTQVPDYPPETRGAFTQTRNNLIEEICRCKIGLYI